MTKVLCISDIHIPFHKPELIKKIFQKHKDATYCIINGDLLDCYSISAYPKVDKCDLQNDYNQAVELVAKASELFPEVILVTGNHEARWERQVLSKLPIDARNFMNKSLLRRIADGERFVKNELVQGKKFKNVFCSEDYENSDTWFVTVGDVVFAHPEKSSVFFCEVTKRTEEYLRNRRGFSDIRGFVTGHTHKLGKVITPNCMYIECGCLCEEGDYSFGPHMQYRYPQSNGYAVVYLDEENKVEFNRSTIEYFE